MAAYWITFVLVGCMCATVAYVWAWRAQCIAVVDVVWSFGLGLGAMAYVLYANVFTVHRLMVLAVLLVWSLRLSYYLFSNRVLSAKKDSRYLALASHWGSAAKRNFYGVFLAQVLLMALFLIPVTVALDAGSDALAILDYLGLAIALISLLGETLSDRILAAFRADPANAGQVCRRGPWRYCRHPNYFFEWLHWWAYVFFAWGSSQWAWSLIGPVAMYCFLNYITGIPHAERVSLQARGAAYRHYQQTTNAFFPWIPHRH